MRTGLVRWLLLAALASLVLSSPALAQQKDDPKCKDHPLFTRMPTFWIRSCANVEFDVHAFEVGKGKTEKVEGKLWRANYHHQATAETRPSQLQILRNFENAATKLGGTVVWSREARETLRLTKDGKEFWVEVTADFTSGHTLLIVERGAMKQDVVANAEVFSNDIRATGHAAVYGIYFDTGKSEIKPESEAALTEIAKLLTTDAGLLVNVVGHTDNVGSVESNMTLSQARADAVVKALTGKHGVAAQRLKAYGVGPLAPVASNDTDEGKAKNRRVELVKR
jgi:outer membrane protein OmpA-like peptidoglycan-associated protein